MSSTSTDRTARSTARYAGSVVATGSILCTISAKSRFSGMVSSTARTRTVRGTFQFADVNARALCVSVICGSGISVTVTVVPGAGARVSETS